MTTGQQDDVILVLAPVGRDAALACQMLAEAGLAAWQCRDVDELRDRTLEYAGAILLTEEALSETALRELAALLGTQPSWSDVPLVVFMDRNGRQTGGPHRDLAGSLGRGRSVLLLERPVRAATFISVMRSAVSARRRQYDIRDHLIAREAAMERERLLQNELSHRVKNTLSIVQSIAWQTRRGTTTQDEFDAAFSARIQSLAQAHELLAAASWQGALIGDVIRQTLTPHADASRQDQQLMIDGPPVRVPSDAAVLLHMAFNELATNAAKYGALSVPDGHVDVRWHIEQNDTEPAVEIDWAESNGPLVHPPSRRGFGSRLIERALAQQLRGQVDLRFDPAGVRCQLRFPAPTSAA